MVQEGSVDAHVAEVTSHAQSTQHTNMHTQKTIFTYMYKHNINSVQLRPLYHQYVSGEGSENETFYIM